MCGGHGGEGISRDLPGRHHAHRWSTQTHTCTPLLPKHLCKEDPDQYLSPYNHLLHGVQGVSDQAESLHTHTHTHTPPSQSSSHGQAQPQEAHLQSHRFGKSTQPMEIHNYLFTHTYFLNNYHAPGTVLVTREVAGHKTWRVHSAAAAKSFQSCLTLCDPRRQPARLRHPWDSPGKNTGVGCHFLLQCMKVKGESEVAQLCPTLSDPMDCSLPGSSIHGIFQARVLEWDAIAFSGVHSRQ